MPMKEELRVLESKVEQVVGLCRSLREENHRLRSQLNALEDEKQGLAERMSEARSRLENLVDRMPGK